MLPSWMVCYVRCNEQISELSCSLDLLGREIVPFAIDQKNLLNITTADASVPMINGKIQLGPCSKPRVSQGY